LVVCINNDGTNGENIAGGRKDCCSKGELVREEVEERDGVREDFCESDKIGTVFCWGFSFEPIDKQKKNF